MRDDVVWYFAYGSNMCAATFLARRSMRPIEARCAYVDGYRLVFDIPVGPGERGVANLLATDEARTHGVAYLLTLDDALRLDRTEGVPQLYARLPISMTTNGGVVPGFTYRSPICVAGRKPSARYMGLLLDGARTHGLPMEYVAALEAMELAVDERVASE